MLSRLLKPPPASRRAYSFFSSKPGGGRYFNSAKPPSSTADRSSPSANGPNAKVDANSSEAGSKKNGEEAQASSLTQQEPVEKTIPAVNHTPLPIHPSVHPQDLRLHQFFSLHRPLLLLPLPPPTIFESSTFSLTPTTDSKPKPNHWLEEQDADADAARQLARAMVMTRVGSTMDWEGTLENLGIDVKEGREEEIEQARYQVYLDSVKRKRRKKMKKHKLKKRRKVQRALRQKLGK